MVLYDGEEKERVKMQTFLPYPDFDKSARCLDWRRLGKQRVEARQILKAIQNPSQKGWQNHPAVNMWRGFESALVEYGNCMIREWVRRGYKNTMPIVEAQKIDLPRWVSDEDFNAAHRSNLLRKDFSFYSQHGWSENTDLEYVWPVAKEATVPPVGNGPMASGVEGMAERNKV
jgi:hypothetical protein